MNEPMSAQPSLLSAVCYVRIAARHLPASARFASEIFGLQKVQEQNGDVSFRSDNRYRTLTLTEDSTDGTSIGMQVRDEAALDEIAHRLAGSVFQNRRASFEECQRRYVQSALLALDASGNQIDFIVRPTQSGRRYFPSRDAGVTGFHNVGIRTVDPEADLKFWRALGAEVSDWVGEIAYVRTDEMHHRVALYPARRSGLLYAAFEVESLDNIMQSSYFMQERQIKIVQGPGRQPASDQIFLHVEGPDGVIFSYVNGMQRLNGGARLARQYPLNAESLCGWGSEANDVPELGASAP